MGLLSSRVFIADDLFNDGITKILGCLHSSSTPAGLYDPSRNQYYFSSVFIISALKCKPGLSTATYSQGEFHFKKITKDAQDVYKKILQLSRGAWIQDLQVSIIKAGIDVKGVSSRN